NRSEEFHHALLTLLQDPEPIVRRNAALALLRFNDAAGRRELLAILEPHLLRTPGAGTIASTLKEGSLVTRGTLLARLQDASGAVREIRSPLPGKIEKLLALNGAKVSENDPLLTISSDDESIWEALRGLALVGEKSDLALIQRYSREDAAVSKKIREQALLTERAIQQRASVGG